jgi:pyruvate dehydrogenase E1 component beta subunit/2-oxoisovalerate dehydrogenase E1 component beta subunit
LIEMSITYLEAIREAQARALADDPRVFIYGQDVGEFGGAFKATKNLAKEFPGRVIDSPISEDAMMGLAVGAAIEGLRPIIEMQFADFSTVGFNQIVNQAATLHWRTRVSCPIVVRLPSGGTSGSGPFHSQSMETLYAHYPGLVVMSPATVEDAYSMLIEAVAIDDPLIF